MHCRFRKTCRRWSHRSLGRHRNRRLCTRSTFLIPFLCRMSKVCRWWSHRSDRGRRRSQCHCSLSTLLIPLPVFFAAPRPAPDAQIRTASVLCMRPPTLCSDCTHSQAAAQASHSTTSGKSQGRARTCNTVSPHNGQNDGTFTALGKAWGSSAMPA